MAEERMNEKLVEFGKFLADQKEDLAKELDEWTPDCPSHSQLDACRMDPEAHVGTAQHLSECERCRQYLEFLKESVHALEYRTAALGRKGDDRSERPPQGADEDTDKAKPSGNESG